MHDYIGSQHAMIQLYYATGVYLDVSIYAPYCWLSIYWLHYERSIYSIRYNCQLYAHYMIQCTRKHGLHTQQAEYILTTLRVIPLTTSCCRSKGQFMHAEAEVNEGRVRSAAAATAGVAIPVTVAAAEAAAKLNARLILRPLLF